MSTKERWYAAGGGIAKQGPYPTQRAAWESMRLADDVRKRTRGASPYPADARVWPEFE